MAKTTSLRDAYRHPGFLPAAQVEADRDDPDAFVLPLRRRRKKTSAVVADAFSPVTTITSRAAPVTSIVVGERSWSNSSFAASIALGAA
jgi:hypothetical protein